VQIKLENSKSSKKKLPTKAELNKAQPPGIKKDTGSEERLKRDLALLIKCYQEIDKVTFSADAIKNSLANLGGFFEVIAWKETDKECIRNKHGYRNRHKDEGNKLNQEGAKLNLELLAKLKRFSQDDAFISKVVSAPSLLKSSLVVIKKKIIFILSCHFNALSKSDQGEFKKLCLQKPGKMQNNKINYLLSLVAYFHDDHCISHLLKLAEGFIHGSYAKFDLSDPIKRYQLGYFFTQFGEIAKEVSDFIKPELHAKSAELDLTRFLFSKFGKLRQIIKNTPWVVYGENNLVLRNMLVRFTMVVNDVKILLVKLKKHIDDSVKSGHKSIYERYPVINISRGNKPSRFESENKSLIEKVTLILSKSGSTMDKQISRLFDMRSDKQKIIAQISQQCQQTQELISQAKATSSKSDEALPRGVKIFQQVFNDLLSSKIVNQLLKLASFCNEGLLNTYGANEDQLRLFKALSLLNNGKVEIDEKKIVPLLKLLKKFQSKVDSSMIFYTKQIAVAISDEKNLLRDDEVVVRLKQGDYLELFKFYLKFRANSHDKLKKEKASLSQDLAKQKRHEKDLSKLKIQIECLEKYRPDFLSHAENVVLKVKSQVKKKSLKLNKPQMVLNSIIVNTEFMELIISHIGNNRSQKGSEFFSLIMAEKMCFGIVGQLYKEVNDETFKLFSDNLIENSLLSANCFEAMLIRHKQVSHNILSGDDTVVHQAAISKVVPWLKDFKYMLTLSFYHDESLVDEVIKRIPLDSRLVSSLDTYDSKNKMMFYRYSKMVILNRFLRSNEILEEYKKLVNIGSDIDPELATEIHWQASLANRNLDRFEDCSVALEKVIEASEKIENKLLRDYKVCAAYCDLAIALIELNRHEEAAEYLEKVTMSGRKSSDQQIICANILLGGIELLNDNSLIGQARLELTFIKYFDALYGYNKGLALTLVAYLGLYYSDHRLFVHANDCIRFGEKILQEDFTDFVSKDGQHAVYYNSMIKPVIIRYRIFESVARSKDDSFLNQLSNELGEIDQQQRSLTYFTRKKDNTSQLLKILTGDKQIDLKDDLMVKMNVESSKKEIRKVMRDLKIKIANFREFSVTSKIDLAYYEESVAHQQKVQDMVTRVVFLYQQLAYTEYQKGNFNAAKMYMRSAVLYQAIEDYIDYQLEANLRLNPQQQSKWFDAPIILSQLQGFVCNMLDNKVNLKIVEHQQSIVKMYYSSAEDPNLRKKLIRDAEVQLMQAFRDEKGKLISMQSFDDKRGLYIQRFWSTDDQGNIFIKERGYKLPVQAPTTNKQSVLASGFRKLQLLRKYQREGEKKSPSMSTALRRAAYKGSANDIVRFIKWGVAINAQDKNLKSRKTALHWAVINKNINCIKVLLQFGARTNIKDAAGKAAGDYAREKNIDLKSLEPVKLSVPSKRI